VIDEAFNGPRQPQAAGRNPFNPFQFAAPGTQAPTPDPTKGVRVVADPSSNSLLVRATPLDMLTIKNLLAKAIDNDTEARGRSSRTASGRYSTPTREGGEHDSVALRGPDGDPRRRRRRSLRRDRLRQRPGPEPAAVANLSIGLDADNNTIYVACTDALFKEIETIVKQMEEGAKNTTRVVKILPTEGVDPTQVQLIVDAIQGRATPQQGMGTGWATPAAAGSADQAAASAGPRRRRL